MKLQRWILMVALGPMLLIALLLTLFFVAARLSSLEANLQDKGRALAEQFAGASELGLFSGNRQMIEEAAGGLLRTSDVEAVIVRDDAGAVMARLGKEQAMSAAVESGRHASFLVVNAPVQRAVTPLNDFFSDGKTVIPTQMGTAIVVLSAESIQKSRRDIILTALMVTIGLTALIWLFITSYVRRFNRRFVELSETVARIGSGDLAAQVSEPGDGTVRIQEVDTLAVGINAMATEISTAHRDLAHRIADATSELGKRRADAERANQAKSRFLAAASHDLRQPLHALGLFADQLSRRSLQGDDARLVTRIVESSNTLSELIDDLLDISRLDAGAVKPKLASIPLLPLLRRLHADFSGAASEKGLDFRLREHDAWVAADSMMLERILINLISNALRYTTEGTVLLAVRRGGPGRIRIEVRDTGIGIREEAQALIFDEFVQLANPERDHAKGLGLGLSIVAKMCQLMNCRYGVRSRLGQGSVFWIELPVAKPLPKPLVETSGMDRKLEGCFVVVVDDDALGLEGLCDQLRSWGAKVCPAASGDEVISALDRLGAVPNVILCDRRLRSGELGEDVVTRLRARFASPIPAILVTGDSGMQLKDAVGSSAFPVLSKPVRPARLRAVLQGVLSRESGEE